MDLFQLQSFLRVADEGNITRAAESLFLTQPAITQQIHSLERELGTVLFDRTRRGVHLTSAGIILRDFTRECMSILDEGKRAIADLEKGKTGRLILGTGVTTSIFHLPQWLRTFREAFPGIDVVVRTGRSREVAAMVLDREIDLGLVTSPVDSPGLDITGLFQEEIVLVTRQNHPLAANSTHPEILANIPLILFPKGTGFRDYLDSILAAAGISPYIKMESDSLEAIKSFVEVGLGASFLPASAVKAEIESGMLERVRIDGLPLLQRTTSVIYRTDRHLSAAARGFLEVLQARS